MKNQYLQLNTSISLTNLLSSKWTFLFYLLGFLCIAPQYNYAQCTVHTRDGGNNDLPIGFDFVGQTFVPCVDGDVTSISVTASTVGTFAGLHELYLAVEPGIGVAIPTTPVASINYAAPPSGVMTFTLTVPFPVLTANTYRFVVEHTTADTKIRYNNGSDYPGSLVRDNNNHLSHDLDFEVNIAPSAAPPPASAGIPTLSEWGLIILSLMFMTLGTLYLLQPNWRESKQQK